MNLLLKNFIGSYIMSSLASDPLPANGWSSITYGNGIFVVVAWGRGVIKSSDGNTWTLVTTPDKNWSSVTYGNGVFVAVAGGGGGVMKSQDGDTWSLVSSPDKNWCSVTYGNGVFVAVAGGGGGGVMKSPDGNTNTWTLVSTPDKNWSSVTYGNGLFVAVAWGGGGVVMTSPDGNTWSLVSTHEKNWSSVAYGNGQFVATAGGVNASEGGVNVMKSPDGIVWSLLPTVGGGTVVDLFVTYTDDPWSNLPNFEGDYSLTYHDQACDFSTVDFGDGIARSGTFVVIGSTSNTPNNKSYWPGTAFVPDYTQLREDAGGIYPPYGGLRSVYNAAFLSGDNTYDANGNYSSNIFTSVFNTQEDTTTNKYGEYLELRSPFPFILKYTSYVGRRLSDTHYAKETIICGSNDNGTTWTLLDRITDADKTRVQTPTDPMVYENELNSGTRLDHNITAYKWFRYIGIKINASTDRSLLYRQVKVKGIIINS